MNNNINLSPKIQGFNMACSISLDAIFLMIADEDIRILISDMLHDNNFSPKIMGDLDELLQEMHDLQFGIVILDCNAVARYGLGIYSKIKVGCQNCRIILCYDKVHFRNKRHKDIVQAAMEVGVYGCIMAPYEEWEVIAMIRHIKAKAQLNDSKERGYF
jgi:DNA-binding NtrC family response regulator